MSSTAADDEDDPTETVVVDRAALSPAHDDIEGTIAIERPPAGGPEDVERTIVVDRAASDDADRTVAIDRAAPDADRTIVIPPGQERPGGPLPPARRPGRAKRIRITLPDDTPASERAADGAGVGATERYAPRAIPTAPLVDLPKPGPEATRTPAPAMPSVLRASRRAGRRALILAAVACVVAIAGVVAIAVALTT